MSIVFAVSLLRLRLRSRGAPYVLLLCTLASCHSPLPDREVRALCADHTKLLQGLQMWAIGHGDKYPSATWIPFGDAGKLQKYATPGLTRWGGRPITYEAWFDVDAGLYCVRTQGAQVIAECARALEPGEAATPLGLCREDGPTAAGPAAPPTSSRRGCTRASSPA